MPSQELCEISIGDACSEKLWKFNAWRKAVASIIGAPVWYLLVDKPVIGLCSEGSGLPPDRLTFLEAGTADPAVRALLAPEARLGIWNGIPDEPLLILLLLTLPGGFVRHKYAGAIAERLGDITDLMYGIDDGSFEQVDLGRFTERMRMAMLAVESSRMDAPVDGGYEPGGWWRVSANFAA